MLFQQGLTEKGDNLVHRASCGLAGCIYQVAGEDGMRRFSLRPHAGGVRGTIGQFRASEPGAEGCARRSLETRGPADSVSFKPIAAQLQAIASARLHAGEIGRRDIEGGGPGAARASPAGHVPYRGEPWTRQGCLRIALEPTAEVASSRRNSAS